MHPVIFSLGPITIHSYGLLLAFSFVAAVVFARKRAERLGVEPDRMIDLGFYIAAISITGSRGLYVLLNRDEFAGRWLDAINIFKGLGGLIFFGGFILAFIFTIYYVRKHSMNIWRVGDIIAPTIAVGLGITRIGCFLNGCCFGLPTASPLGVVFPPGSPAGAIYFAQHVHPTQLYSSLNGFFMAVVLLLAEKRFRTFDGFTFWLFAVMYGIFRFGIEMIRHQEKWLLVPGGLSISQVVSLVIVITGIIFLYRGFRQGGIQKPGMSTN